MNSLNRQDMFEDDTLSKRDILRFEEELSKNPLLVSEEESKFYKRLITDKLNEYGYEMQIYGSKAPNAPEPFSLTIIIGGINRRNIYCWHIRYQECQ